MSKKPNLVFILSDQHRFCDSGFMGNTQLSTPCLDRLAAGGAVFEHAYSNCPVCVPARGTLLTGLHAFNHGAAANDMSLAVTRGIGNSLSEAGYRTAYIGKWNLGGVPRDRYIDRNERLGFEFWRANNCCHDYMHSYYFDNDNVRHEIDGYSPIGFTDIALSYIKEQASGNKPFAMFLSYSPPHDPYLLMPPEDVALCEARAPHVRLRRNVSEITEDKYVPPKGHHAYGTTDPWAKYRKEVTTDKLRSDLAGYYRHIEKLDEQIGRVIDLLKEQGVYEDTVIVYTSDHGNMLGSHGCLNKQWYFEESVRVPFVINWPGKITSGRRDQVISLVDVVPSLLGLLGIRSHDKYDGADVSRAFLDRDADMSNIAYLYNIVPAHQAWRREIFSWRAITDGHLVYVANQDASPLAMYDLDTDPYEFNNLLPSNPFAGGNLKQLLEIEVNKYDGFLPWQDLLRNYGLADEWNKSQAHFGYPTL